MNQTDQQKTDDVLRRMLATLPKPHEFEKESKADQPRRSKER